MRARRVVLTVVCLAAFLTSARGGDDTARLLEKAKVGEWILQKSVGQGFTSWMYFWIAKVEGRKVTINTQLLKDEKIASTAPIVHVVDLDQKTDPQRADEAKPKVSEEVVEIKGRRIKCTKSVVEQGANATTIWTSSEIPIYGIAKSEIKKDGKVISESAVVDFGHEGGSERPQK